MLSLKRSDDVNETDVGADNKTNATEDDDTYVLQKHEVVTAKIVRPKYTDFNNGWKSNA